MASEWPLRALAEMSVNFDTQRKPVKEAERVAGPYPYYGASGIVDHVNGYLFDGDYLLVAEDGENLRTRNTPIAFRATGKFWVNNHAHILQGNENASTRYLEYALLAANITPYLTGAVMPKLTQGNLNKIELACPSLEEQRAITEILGALDDRIDNLRQTNATLEAIAAALFKSWFVDFDGVVQEDMQESELGLIPKGWTVRSLDSIADYLNGLALQKFPPESEAEFLPVIKIAQLRAGHTNGSDRASAHLKPEYIVDDGDVLFSWSGSLEVEVWTGGRGALNQHLFKVTSREVPKWFYYFATRQHLSDFRTIAAGKATTMGHIQRGHLAAAKVTVPSQDEMAKFDAIIAPIFEQTIGNALQARTLSTLRDALLPRLISGQLRIGDAARMTDEIA